MTYLQAQSIGAPIATLEQSGAVHSIFEHACNIRLDTGDVVTLLVSRAGNQPQGVVLETSQGFSFQHCDLVAGQSVTLTPDKLVVEGDRLHVNLRHAHRWDVPIPIINWSNDAVQNALEDARHVVETSQWSQHLSCLLTDLQGAVVGEDYRRTAHIVSQLIGLGPGVTPSGDDVLIGFVAGLHAMKSAFAQHLCEAVQLALPRTNDISQTFLRYACKGLVSEWVLKSLIAMAAGNAALALFSTQSALQIGHSSGLDTMQGLFAGINCHIGSVVYG